MRRTAPVLQEPTTGGPHRVQQACRVLASATTTLALSLCAVTAPNAADDRSIRPFTVQIPQATLDDLRRRVKATRWPDRETVGDFSQGVQLEKLKPLMEYWGTSYDWRKAEAKLNALPQFVTSIDGLDIHFIHVRSPHPKALPLIMTHGWPGSLFELLKTIGPLTDPTAHGGGTEDAFDLVLPSIPGFGFSEQPEGTGWGPERIAGTWDALMKRLGYTRYVAQGGDWGAIIADAMGRQAPPGLLGIHVNRVDRASTIPPDVAKALRNGEPAPAGLTAEERAVFDQTREFYKNGLGYAAIMGTRPQTIGYSLADLPVGLATWCYDKFADWVLTRGEPERSLTRDEMLDNITLYWLTNTGDLGRADLLGEQRQPQGSRCRHSRSGDGLPRRDLPGAEELGGTCLPQAHLLPSSGQRRPFRGLGRARALLGRAPRGLPLASLVLEDERRST